MSKTYLQAVNDVLVRLREVQVSTVTQTSYSTLIGRFVNDAKRQIEDAFNWNALFSNVTVTTSAGVSSYSVTGSGNKFRVSDAINVTSEIPLQNISFAEMNRYLSFGTPAQNIPTYYAFNGVDGSYDTKVNVFPVPDSAYSLKFSLIIPQAELSSDSTVIKVADDLVIQNAYARALVERGEDGGLNSSEAYALYRQMLSDYIALEATRYPESQEFIAI
jgi:hypothetical protein